MSARPSDASLCRHPSTVTYEHYLRLGGEERQELGPGWRVCTVCWLPLQVSEVRR